MNRRTFLKTSLAAATLAHLPAPVTAADVAKQKIRIGFLGVAHSHAAGKVSVAQSSADWDLVGICEDGVALRDRFEKQGVRLLSQAELFGKSQVVAVESAVRDHFQHAKAALTAGKHVHVEKPPTTSLAEFKELQALASQNKCLMQMGYMWRYHPGFAKIAEAMRAGWLGEISSIRCSMNSLINTPAARAELVEFRGGGMFELGSHLIDAVVRLLGRPEKITPTLRTHGRFNDKLADNAVAVFEYPRALATINIDLLQPNAHAHRAFEVVGSNGTAWMQPIEPPTLQLDLAKAAGPYPAKQHTVTLPKYQRYAPELADLADAVRNKRALAITPETDLLVQECVLQACQM